MLGALAGVGLLVIGVAVLLERLRFPGGVASVVASYWPVLVIALGVFAIVRRLLALSGPVAIGPLVVIAAGLILLTLTLPDLGAVIGPWILPGVLIGAGALVLAGVASARGREPDAGLLQSRILVAESTDVIWPVGACSAGQLTAVVSGTAVDIRNSVPYENKCRLDLTVVLGGLVVRVPSSWHVVIDVRSLAGRSRKTIGASADTGPLVELHVLTILGRVRVTAAAAHPD